MYRMYDDIFEFAGAGALCLRQGRFQLLHVADSHSLFRHQVRAV